MGPNAKAAPRRQYVNYRLRVLKELRIAPPPRERIEEMLDESRMSEAAVDRVFLDCIRRAGTGMRG